MVNFFNKIQITILFLCISLSGFFGVFIEPVCLCVLLILRNDFYRVFFVKKGIFFSVLFVLIISLLSTYSVGYSSYKLFQQVLLVFTVVQLYQALYKSFNGDLSLLFKAYVNFAVFLAIVGIVQFFYMRYFGESLFSWADREDINYSEESMRARAWCGEPAPYAALLLPASIYSINENGIINIKTILLLLGGILAFTPVYYILVSIYLVYYVIVLSKRRLIAVLLLIPIVLYASLSFKESEDNVALLDSQTKLNETLALMSNFDVSDIEGANLSTYALASNIYVSLKAPNRFFGTGIGSHSQNYGNEYNSSYYYYGLNKEDAYSLFVRIFSEFGFLGIVILIAFLVMNFNRKNIINVSCLFYILFQLLRGGHYTLYGVQFFFLLFYYSNKRFSVENKDDNYEEIESE